VRRQVYATFQEDRTPIECIDAFGVDRVMWADDYPHTDTTWPHSQRIIAEHFSTMPEEKKRKVICENAGKLYGWIK
jgi:predicted TIM-barrel fold metal-dependent hydrolase